MYWSSLIALIAVAILYMKIRNRAEHFTPGYPSTFLNAKMFVNASNYPYLQIGKPTTCPPIRRPPLPRKPKQCIVRRRIANECGGGGGSYDDDGDGGGGGGVVVLRWLMDRQALLRVARER